MKAQKRPRNKKFEAADLPSPKNFETDDSVRSKLRESLTAALRIIDSAASDRSQLGTRTDEPIDDSEKSRLGFATDEPIDDSDRSRLGTRTNEPLGDSGKSQSVIRTDEQIDDSDKSRLGTRTDEQTDDFNEAPKPTERLEDMKKSPPCPEVEKSEVINLVAGFYLDSNHQEVKTENEVDDSDRGLEPRLIMETTRKEQLSIDFENDASIAFQTVYDPDLDWDLQGTEIEYGIDDCDGIFEPMELQGGISSDQSILRLVEEAVLDEKEAQSEGPGECNLRSHESSGPGEVDEKPCKRMKMDSETGGGDKQGQQAHNVAEKVAIDIESELYRQFNGVNRKYKEKARSLLFNLKDRSNPELRARVLSGEITPDSLCSMNVEQLASKELSQWRLAKAEELVHMVVLNDPDADKLRLVKKTHKGEVEVTVEKDDVLTDVVTAGSQQRVAFPTKQETEGLATTAGDMPANAGSENVIGVESQKFLSLSRDPNATEGYKEMETAMGFESGDLESKPEVDETKPASENHSGSIALQASKNRKSQSHKTVDSPNHKSQESGASKNVSTSVKERKKENKVDEKLWKGSFQVANCEISSVFAIYKSGDAMELQNWPKQIEIKGRVRLDALEKFLRELRMSRTRAVMIITCLVSEDASVNSIKEVANQYQQGERVGYAEPLAGYELYLFPGSGDSLGLLKNHGYLTADQIVEEEGLLVGFVVCKRSLIPAISSYKSSNHYYNANRHVLSAQLNSPTRPNEIHSSGNANTTSKAHERKNHASSVSIVNFRKDVRVPNHATEGAMRRSYSRSEKYKPEWMEQDEGIDDDLPPGFGPKTLKRRFEMDNDDLPEYDFSSHSTPTNIYVKSTHPLPQPYNVQVPISRNYGVASLSETGRNCQSNRESLNSLDVVNTSGLQPAHYARSSVSHASGQMEQIRTLPSSAQASQPNSIHLAGYRGFPPRVNLPADESFSTRMPNVSLMDRDNLRGANEERTRALMPVMQSHLAVTGGRQRAAGSQMRSVWSDDDMPEWHPDAEHNALHPAMLPREAGGGTQIRGVVHPPGWQNARSAGAPALPLASMVEGAILQAQSPAAAAAAYSRGMLLPLSRPEQLPAFRDPKQ